MQLIGMMDSPYVRRVAITLKLLGVAHEHHQVSVLGGYDDFAQKNPVVMAPTLITADGAALMESTLILAYLEDIAPSATLNPRGAPARIDALRSLGVSLAACQKTVQIVYETRLRPAEKRYEPWLDRLLGQLTAAYDLLEAMSPPEPTWTSAEDIMQSDLTSAVAWRFTQFAVPGAFEPQDYPKLAAASARAEALPEFRSSPLE